MTLSYSSVKKDGEVLKACRVVGLAHRPQNRGAGVLGEERLVGLARGLERRGGVAAWRP